MALVLKGDCSLTEDTSIEVFESTDCLLTIRMEDLDGTVSLISLDKESSKYFLESFMLVFNSLQYNG